MGSATASRCRFTVVAGVVGALCLPVLLSASGCAGGRATADTKPAKTGSALPAIPTDSRTAAPGSPATSDSLPSVPTTTAPAATVAPAARAVSARLGVQVYWHTAGDVDEVRARADRVFDYIVGLGANSVGITFPFYTDGPKPTHVYSTPETPGVDTVGIVIDEAQSRGLDVMLRPVLDEGNMLSTPEAWRGNIAPSNPAAWMSSYSTFLASYLALAQSKHIGEFVIGTELTSMTTAPGNLWDPVMRAARDAYSGEISYGDNWDSWRAGTTASPAPVTGLDAYPALQLPDSATVAQLTDAWRGYLSNRPLVVRQQTVIQEIGIAAQSGAYKKPYVWGDSKTPVNVLIQRNWFTAACQSAKSEGLRGIYFWSVDGNADPASAAPSPSGSFIGRSDDVIKECFADGWH